MESLYLCLLTVKHRTSRTQPSRPNNFCGLRRYTAELSHIEAGLSMYLYTTQTKLVLSVQKRQMTTSSTVARTLHCQVPFSWKTGWNTNPCPTFTSVHFHDETVFFFFYPCATTEETLSPLLPVNNSQQEYCITSDGDVMLVGDSWKANACTSCTCNNGTIQCFSQRCPAANCRVPVLRKGQCCPHCLGEYFGACQ